MLLALSRGAATVVAAGRNIESLERLAAVDPRVRVVSVTGDRRRDGDAIRTELDGDADIVIDALGAAPTTDITMAGYDVIRMDGTMVLLGGVRADLPIPYGDLMRRRLTVRGSWMTSNDAVLPLWRQVRSGVLDLGVLDVERIGLDDPKRALDLAESRRGLSYLALTP